MNERTRFRLAILRNEMDNDHANWLKACEHMADRVEYEVVNLSKDHWALLIRDGKYDGLLAQPTGWSSSMKALYDKRAGILGHLGLPMIPSCAEIAIYENKRALAGWLEANGIPHPRTRIFCTVDEAVAFLGSASFPLVAKTSMGAGGSGVRILRSAEEALDYVERTFNGPGAPRDSGPNWRRQGFAARALRKLARPAAVLARLREYRTIKNDAQRDHVLFQAFVPHTFEWRAVRIGDSFFAHKKLVKSDMASGSLLKEYGDPPKDLLDFVRKITDDHGFRSVAIDVFEAPEGGYLVNEVQCVFGQSDPHQMIVEDVPGRYRWVNEAWLFEPGEFNRYESYLLRLEYLIEVLSSVPSRPSSPASVL
jgi:glutathione synthase/RimK-type ligase-like ATP-grasp enzyme